MQPMYYIGLDVHKQKISYCVKEGGGKVFAEGWIPATRFDLDRWMKTLPQPWSAAMEATMFTGWIYHHLKPQAAALKVAHPLMLRAIVLAPNLCRETGRLTFDSPEVQLRKFRERLQKMSDEELIDFGRRLGRIPKRVSGVPDPFNELAEARAEWRRRHPRTS